MIISILKVSSLYLAFISFSALSAVAPPLDPSEEYPAGTGTTSDFSVQAFSHPLSGTLSSDRRNFTVGNSFFNKVWVSAPASTTARDGLGPIYNAVACSSCHFKDGRGRGLPESAGQTDVSLLFRLRIKGLEKEAIPHPHYGGQFQPFGIQDVPGEGESRVSYEKINISYEDGVLTELLRPIYEFIKMNFGELGPKTIISPRVAPQMIGLGLVEAIPEEDILKNEDPLDVNGDGVSGRANWVISSVSNTRVMGRFGWKAGKPSLIEQNAAAFNGDIGITSALNPIEECTSVQTDCLKNQSNEDLPMERLKSVTAYTQLLTVPARRDIQRLEVKNGREHFYKINCTSCHTPSFKTSQDSPINVLKGQTIYPYSDFLLHDMGDDLADDIEEFNNEAEATTKEWRTPPLWGLGLTQTVNGHTRYLHDGRARNIEEAILWHGGEALSSKKAFMELTKTQREELILFIQSL